MAEFWSGITQLKPDSGARISPGSVQGCRVALPWGYSVDNANTIFFATENEIYQIKVEALPKETLMSLPAPVDMKDTPHPLPVQSSHQTVKYQQRHRAEIQNLAWLSPEGPQGPGQLFSVDSLGQGLVHHFSPHGHEKLSEVRLSAIPARELGHSSIASSPDGQTIVASRASDKLISQFDANGNLVRSVRSLQDPSQLAFSPGAGLFALSERNTLSLWDFRAPGNCVKRILTEDLLHAVDCSKDLIGAAGSSRTVQVFDCKKLVSSGKWANATKYDITHFRFSTSDEKLSYAAGLDSELTCGEWRGNNTARMDGLEMRVEARWIGLAQDPVSDVLVGATDSGHVYTIHNATQLHYRSQVLAPPKPSKRKTPAEGASEAAEASKEVSRPAKRAKKNSEVKEATR